MLVLPGRFRHRNGCQTPKLWSQLLRNGTGCETSNTAAVLAFGPNTRWKSFTLFRRAIENVTKRCTSHGYSTYVWKKAVSWRMAILKRSTKAVQSCRETRSRMKTGRQPCSKTSLVVLRRLRHLVPPMHTGFCLDMMFSKLMQTLRIRRVTSRVLTLGYGFQRSNGPKSGFQAPRG